MSLTSLQFLQVTVIGEQNHAGTVPMQMRKDALAGAAEIILSIERLCSTIEASRGTAQARSKQECTIRSANKYKTTCTNADNKSLSSLLNQIQSHSGMLVCTVGQLDVWPGSSNAIAGRSVFSVDIRSGSNMERESALKLVMLSINTICNQRGLDCSIVKRHEANAVKCSSHIIKNLFDSAQEAVSKASEIIDHISSSDLDVVGVCTNSKHEDCTLWNPSSIIPMLVSGAGHDGLAMAKICPIGMVFVRDNGISHSPKEQVDALDIAAAILTLVKYLEKEAMSRAL